MKKRILIFLALCIFMSLPAQAQEAIRYGQPVTAEMTAGEFEFTYTFDGKVNDVIVISMSADDALGDLRRTKLTLQNAAGGILAEYASFSSVRLFAQLPENAAYTIIATRPNGVEGTEVGKFTLSVDRIPMIEIGATATNTISSARGGHYYAYSGSIDFYITYRKITGDFFPEVSVNKIGFSSNDGQLDSVGVMSGDSFRIGSIGTFTGDQLYVIKLDKALFDFNFSEVTAEYILDILDAAKLQ